MSNALFRALLDWFMVSDPWILDQESHNLIKSALDSESTQRGYYNWVVAFHEFKKINDSNNVKLDIHKAITEIDKCEKCFLCRGHRPNKEKEQ